MKKRKGPGKKKRRARKKVISLVGQGIGDTISKVAKAPVAPFSGEEAGVRILFQYLYGVGRKAHGTRCDDCSCIKSFPLGP